MNSGPSGRTEKGTLEIRLVTIQSKHCRACLGNKRCLKKKTQESVVEDRLESLEIVCLTTLSGSITALTSSYIDSRRARGLSFCPAWVSSRIM